MNPEFEKIDARVLEPPKLMYGNGPTMVSKGAWRLQKTFLQPSQNMQKWTVLSMDNYVKDQNMMSLCDFVIKEGNFFHISSCALLHYRFGWNVVSFAGDKLGMTIGKPSTPFGQCDPRGAPHQLLQKLKGQFDSLKQKGITFVIVIIPDKLAAYGMSLCLWHISMN